MNITSDPADLGFDTNRLARIDKHFAKYVDDGRLAGWQLAVTRGDELAHFASYGLRDKEAGLPVESDTIWRIASMTKPITSVAAMALWEEGVFQLTDPISKWIPSFADARVYDKGSVEAPRTVPALEPIRVWHLLSHTSGLTAGFMNTSVVDALYRQAETDFATRTDGSLEAAVDEWASLPLLFQPGTAWGYGMSTDVLGRLIEIWTGEKLDKAMDNLVLDPLGMVDSVWYADESRVDRLAAVYARDPATGSAVRSDVVGAAALQPPPMFSGGGGLLGTTADYLRFTRMLERGGELDGARVLAPRTVRLMASNHLDGDLAGQSTGGFTEYVFDGVGFGLGFATSLEPSRQRNHSSAGEFYWGGAGSTVFWVDPVERVTAVFMTQLVPAGTHPINAEFRQLVYSALVD